MSRFLSEKYDLLVPYTPGEQPKERKYVKLNTNESPFPPSDKAIDFASKQLDKLMLYPDPDCRELTTILAERLGVGNDNIILTNGSDEVLNFAFMAYCSKYCPAVFADITYGFYSVFADINGVPSTVLPLKSDFTMDVDAFASAKGTLFIANPNAPTGIALTIEEIERLLVSHPNNVVVIDEAYVDFGAESAVGLIDRYPNLLVTQTFSKSRSMAGARLGFGVANREIIADLQRLRYSNNPYNVNRMTAAAGEGALLDDEYFRSNCAAIVENRAFITEALERIGFTHTDSAANFIFVRHPDVDGETLYRELKKRGVLVRHFDKPSIKDYNRITVGSREQMDVLLAAIKEILEELQ